LAGQVASVGIRAALVGIQAASVEVSVVAREASGELVGLEVRVVSVVRVAPAVSEQVERLVGRGNCLALLEEMEYPALQFLQTAAYHNFNSSLLRPAARMLAVGSLAESDKELDLVEV
jgi:hypothetical protein